MHYGTIIHDACEHFLKTKEIRSEEAKQKIKDAWDEHGFDADDFIQLQSNRAQLQGWKYKHNKIKDWLVWTDASLSSIPAFLDETFPGWEFVSAEDELYESINNINTITKIIQNHILSKQ